jgi:predicted nucleic acid-binding protein
MSLFVLDTGILVGYIRGAGYAEYVEKRFHVNEPPSIPVISTVTKGEIYSIAIQFGWGEKKRSSLDALLRKLAFVDIGTDPIIERYAEIDSYSQCKNPLRPTPPGLTPRNMGKNDLWIAATGSVLNATLITTDDDFNHLNKVFLDVVRIDQTLTGADADE